MKINWKNPSWFHCLIIALVGAVILLTVLSFFMNH